jgi:hypothetical protein
MRRCGPFAVHAHNIGLRRIAVTDVRHVVNVDRGVPHLLNWKIV